MVQVAVMLKKAMFNFFKKKDPVVLFQKEYQKLMAEAHRLSSINRKESDQKVAEAEKILQKIKDLQKH